MPQPFLFIDFSVLCDESAMTFYMRHHIVVIETEVNAAFNSGGTLKGTLTSIIGISCLFVVS